MLPGNSPARCGVQMNQKRNQNRGNNGAPGRARPAPKGQPRPRQQPQPKKQAQPRVRRVQGGPSGGLAGSYFNAFLRREHPGVTSAIGPTTCLPTHCFKQIETYNDKSVLVVATPGPTAMFSCAWTLSDADPAVVTGPHDQLEWATINKDGTPPDQGIPARFSLRIRNTTPRLYQGGIVRSLRLATGIGADGMSGSEVISLASLIRNHPRTRTYSGSELSNALQWDAGIANKTKYQDIRKWHANNTTDSLTEWYENLENPAMSVLCYLFEPVPSYGEDKINNTYEFTYAGVYHGRYSATSVLQHQAKPPPTVTDAFLNSASKILEGRESIGQAVSWAASHAGPLLEYAMAPQYFGNPMQAAPRAGRMLALTNG